MTVSYQGDITTASPVSFLHVLFRWRGSVWKHVCREMAFWVVLYFSISLVYLLLPTDMQIAFERFAVQVDARVSRFPLELLLGFFVDLVYGQWKDIFDNIGWIDNPALFTAAYIKGKDAATNILRKTIMRYLCLSQVLVLRDTSLRVRERFPTLDAVQDAGYLTSDEKEKLLTLHEYEKDHWMPTKWACELAMRATDDGRISTPSLTHGLFKEINYFQRKLRRLLEFDVIPIPLAYPQMAFIAVRSYFLLLCFSRQFQIHSATTQANLVLPFMTLLQIFFYLAWAKVAEVQLNPLGTDDDDFESNYIIDRNLTVSMLMAGRFSQHYPEQRPDAFDKQEGTPTPPPPSSEEPAHHSYRGSVAHVQFRKQAKMVKKNNGQSQTFAAADNVGNRAKTVKMIPRAPRTFATADTAGNIA